MGKGRFCLINSSQVHNVLYFAGKLIVSVIRRVSIRVNILDSVAQRGQLSLVMLSIVDEMLETSFWNYKANELIVEKLEISIPELI